MKFAMKSSFGAVAAATLASATFATDRLVPQQYPTIQAAVDEALLAQGITAIRSWVVAGPDADAMEAAIVARGGMRQTVAPRETVTGDQVQYVEFLRPLVS